VLWCMVAVSMLTNTVIMGFSSEQLAEWLPWMYKTIEGDQYIKEGYGRYIVFCNFSFWLEDQVGAIWEKRWYIALVISSKRDFFPFLLWAYHNLHPWEVSANSHFRNNYCWITLIYHLFPSKNRNSKLQRRIFICLCRYIVAWVFAFEHFLILSALFITWFVNSQPKWVRVAKAKEKYENKVEAQEAILFTSERKHSLRNSKKTQ
jgi:hypothetical protein